MIPFLKKKPLTCAELSAYAGHDYDESGEASHPGQQLERAKHERAQRLRTFLQTPHDDDDDSGDAGSLKRKIPTQIETT